jgi:YgiT-type zinc finger domain-containing protein
MTCFFCNGTLKEGTTTHVSDIGERTVIVRGVPCLKCNQCTEISYTGTVYEQVEIILDGLKNSAMDVAIATYSSKVA